MNNFLETLKSQFIENPSVSLIVFDETLEKYLNADTEIIMYVYKSLEAHDIISIEFVGV